MNKKYQLYLIISQEILAPIYYIWETENLCFWYRDVIIYEDFNGLQHLEMALMAWKYKYQKTITFATSQSLPT